MKSIVLIFINCSLLLSINAQKTHTTGFYGKHNYLDLSMNLNSPLLYKAFFRSSDNNDQKIKSLNSGISLQLGRIFKNNKGLALNFSSYRLACYSPVDFTIPNVNYYFSGNFDQFITKTTSFMPVYTSSYFDNAPMGLEFEAGIGFNTTRVENNGLTYYAQYQSNQIFEQNLLTNQTLYDFSQKFKSFNIMLGLKTRYALSENLLVNLGIRFTASSRLKNSNIAINEYTNDFQDKLLTNAIDMRLHRIVVLGVGLSYVF
jgi:hypothetical protein